MNAALIGRILETTPGWNAQAQAAGLDATDIAQMLQAAETLAQDRMAPLAAQADAQGCRLVDGRVVTPKGYKTLYRQMGADGWIAPDLPPRLGGLGLPLACHVATSLFFEGAAQPFMMAHGAARAAAHCLAQTAPDLAELWAPRLAAGDWCATICISEPDAGSDVGRIRTRAEADGPLWRLSGTKCWISFGDHDLTDRIGHLALARTGPPDEGTRGLSLFLVPDVQDDGTRNGITVERIEDKLGLHGSPTCVLRFDGAQAHLVGEAGRGLPLLFRMIELMRLQVGTQGAGFARDCARIARGYAQDRRQGGRPDAPPMPIVRHPDVDRQLVWLDARAVLLAALALDTAVTMEAGRAGDARAAARSALLLPLVKTFGGELGQANADGAIQVLGGAGYTRDWPVERHFRDARITTLYEGTTGMQAQDFVLRRLLRDPEALGLFCAPLAGSAALCDRFRALVQQIAQAPQPVQLRAADAVMRAGWCVLADALAQRLGFALPETAPAMALWQAHAPADMARAEASVAWAATA